MLCCVRCGRIHLWSRETYIYRLRAHLIGTIKYHLLLKLFVTNICKIIGYFEIIHGMLRNIIKIKLSGIIMTL